ERNVNWRQQSARHYGSARVTKITRRRAAAMFGGGAFAFAQDRGRLALGGRPVEISVTSISPQTARLSIQAIDEHGQTGPIVSNGSLAQESWGKPVTRIRNLAGARSVRCGDLTVKLTVNPLVIRVESRDGRLIQALTPDPETGKLAFHLGE